MKTLQELQSKCDALGLRVADSGSRPSKSNYVIALRDYYWQRDHPEEPLPEQISPMLLSDWSDLADTDAAHIQRDDSGWVVQPKFDGVRALLHVSPDGVRITGRRASDVTCRVSEFQENLPHLAVGLGGVAGTVIDGELVCPLSSINTGATVTRHALQAVTAILATRPANAVAIQNQQKAFLQFHVFDCLRVGGRDMLAEPLHVRMAAMHDALAAVDNPCVQPVLTVDTDKRSFHEQRTADGWEGTVWKRLDAYYEPGQRVAHWVKHKRRITLEAFVTDFRLGSTGRRHADAVGALEFSVRSEDGPVSPVAWVSTLPDDQRRHMLDPSPGDAVRLAASVYGRRALIAGDSWSRKSNRLRHARVVRWLAT